MTNSRVLILGAGGHARVLIDALKSKPDTTIVAVLDPQESFWGETLLGIHIAGGDDMIDEVIQKEKITHFVVGVGSVGDPSLRIRLFELGISRGLLAHSVIHTTAFCSSFAKVESGAQLLPSSVVNAGAQIGKNVIINSGVIVEHDCLIENHVHIATGAHLSGTVIVEEGAHVGTGATILQGRRIGKRAIVGAGAVVIKDVAANVTVVGNPAHPLN